jgi:hypothetical protein
MTARAVGPGPVPDPDIATAGLSDLGMGTGEASARMSPGLVKISLHLRAAVQWLASGLDGMGEVRGLTLVY